MKRHYKLLRIVVVAVSICLLTVDPAAACRLLGGRRCCCCVCSPCETACQAMSCTTAVPAQGEKSDEGPADAAESAPPTEALPSPSDAPPGPSTGGATLRPSQEARPNNDQSRSSSTRRTLPEPAAVNSTTTLTFGEPQQPSPANLDRATTEPAVIHEPAAGPLSVAPGPRDPAAIGPVAADPIKTPSVASDESARSEPALDAPTARDIEVHPRSTHEPATTAATPQPMDIQRSSAAPTLPGMKPATDSPLTAVPAPPSGGRTPAAALPKPAKTAVDAPDFPAASDDPFAPMPKKPQPAEDDPFAPLPQVKQPAAEPAAPLAAEPTNYKTKDALTLGPDGKLPVRQWRDNSGRFEIKAKLLLILDGKVRLLKETGRATTVSLERLSAEDRAYVNEVIGRYGHDLTTLDQLAAR